MVLHNFPNEKEHSKVIMVPQNTVTSNSGSKCCGFQDLKHLKGHLQTSFEIAVLEYRRSSPLKIS